jgi:hypothetical protein
MAGMMPFFLTGATAKIKVNGRTLAYCTDFSYRIETNHQPARICGMFEPASLEPVGYSVSGGFNVVRYTKNMTEHVKEAGGKVPNGVSDKGNGIGGWGDSNSPFDGKANEAFDPSKLQSAVYFDIEVYQKTPAGQVGVAKFRNCKIRASDFNINKK